MESSLVQMLLLMLAVFAIAVLLSICLLAIFKSRGFVTVKSQTYFFLLSYAIAFFVTAVFSFLLFNK